MNGQEQIQRAEDHQPGPKIRVLIFNLYTETGGGENSLCNILRTMDREHVVPIMVFPQEGAFKRKVERLGVETIVFSFPVVMLKQLIIPSVFFKTMRASRRIYRLLLEKKIDVVQCSDLLSLLILALPVMLSRIPVVYSVIFFHEWTRMIAFNILALMFVDIIVTNSESVAKDLNQRTMMLDDKIETILPGVDTKIFRPLERGEINLLRQELQIPLSIRIIGMVARFDPVKGHDTFLRTAAELLRTCTDLHFVVIGGLMNKKIYPSVDDYHQSVLRESGWLREEKKLSFLNDREDLPELLRGIDLLVCPSLSEGFGLIVLEALASGVPVVLSRSVGASDMVRNLPGVYIVNEPTPSLLAAAVKNAMDDQNNRPIGVRDYLSREFDWGRSSRRFEFLYKSLLQQEVTSHHYSEWSTIL